MQGGEAERGLQLDVPWWRSQFADQAHRKRLFVDTCGRIEVADCADVLDPAT